MYNCNHKENMVNSFYIHKRWSSYFPAKKTRGQTLTQRDLVRQCHRNWNFNIFGYNNNKETSLMCIMSDN